MPIPFLNSIKLNKNQVEDFCVFNYSGDPTLSSGADFGYLWLNTSATPKVLKFWDGTNYRTLIDSTTISSSTAGTANDLSGGVAGSLPYQQGVGDTTFLGIGTADQVLTVNSGATAPQWLSQSSLSVGSATNKTGGNLGDLLVQSGSGTTSFLSAGTAGQVITSNGASPQYVNQSTLSVGSATTATTATNVAGGANGSILVQSGAGTTGQLAIGANGYILTSNGTTPGWSATIPSTSVSGLAASATTDTTNASNISSGTLGLARLALATGQFYVGDGSNNPAATAKSSIPLSGFDAAGADVAMGGFKITGLADPAAATDAATRGYVDSVAQGLDVKASCLVATTADITLASPGAVTIDGIYSATDFTAGTTRILVKDQSAPAENGIYIWQGPAAAMTRSADADTWDELVGAFTFIERGTANADSGWVCSVNAGGTLGSTAVTWVKFSQAGSYTQGRGMVLDGTAFNFAQSTNYTTNTIPYASGATTIGFIGAGTADQVLRVPGAGGTPAFGAIDLTKSAAVTGALPAANGGTGQSSYAVGDILFADSATSLAKLADVATGNALISGGVTTAPSWGKIGLATHVSGTLPVGNGGTGATTFTAGQVLYGNGTSALSSSANLFWDAANNRLGIGTATPLSQVHSATNIAAANHDWTSQFVAPTVGFLAASNDSSAWIRIATYNSNPTHDPYLNFLTSGGQNWSIGIDNSDSDKLKVAMAAGFSGSNEFLTIDSTGNVGIGTTTPSGKLHVEGANIVLKNGTGVPFFQIAGRNTDGRAEFNFLNNGLSVNNAKLVGYTNTLAFEVAGSERLRIDSSGNLGLGVTPSAWQANWKVLQFTNGSSIGNPFNGAGTFVGSNTYRNSSGDYVRLDADAAALYVQLTGSHRWHVAGTSTAGSTIPSFSTGSQAMILDQSGNLGLGVTPNTWAAVFKAIQFPDGYAAIAGDNGNGVAEITSNAYNDGAWKFRNAQGAVRYRLDAINKTHTWFNTSTTPTANGAITWTPALTLDASGNLALGTSTANFRADIQNASGAAVLRLKGGTGAAQGSAVYMTYAGGANTLLGIGDRATILGGTPDQLACIYSGVALTFEISGAERLRLKTTGQVNFVGLASDPAGAAGDVVYNSTSNRLKYHNGTAWVDSGTRKYSTALAGTSTTFDVTHNLGTQDVTVMVRKSASTFDVVYTDIQVATTNKVTIVFASSVTGSDYTVTVIG